VPGGLSGRVPDGARGASPRCWYPVAPDHPPRGSLRPQLPTYEVSPLLLSVPRSNSTETPLCGTGLVPIANVNARGRPRHWVTD
jgi:hypothetical protein